MAYIHVKTGMSKSDPCLASPVYFKSYYLDTDTIRNGLVVLYLDLMLYVYGSKAGWLILFVDKRVGGM